MDDDTTFDDFGGGFDLGGGDPGMTSLTDATWGVNPIRLPSIAGGLMGNPGRLVAAGGAAASSIMTAVGKISMRKVWAAVKKFGPEFTAAGLGWSASDLMTALFSSNVMSGRRRRGRGISARDVRTTKRVCRFVHRIQHDLAGCAAPRRRHRA